MGTSLELIAHAHPSRFVRDSVIHSNIQNVRSHGDVKHRLVRNAVRRKTVREELLEELWIVLLGNIGVAPGAMVTVQVTRNMYAVGHILDTPNKTN